IALTSQFFDELTPRRVKRERIVARRVPGVAHPSSLVVVETSSTGSVASAVVSVSPSVSSPDSLSQSSELSVMSVMQRRSPPKGRIRLSSAENSIDGSGSPAPGSTVNRSTVVTGAIWKFGRFNCTIGVVGANQLDPLMPPMGPFDRANERSEKKSLKIDV